MLCTGDAAPISELFWDDAPRFDFRMLRFVENMKALSLCCCNEVIHLLCITRVITDQYKRRINGCIIRNIPRVTASRYIYRAILRAIDGE